MADEKVSREHFMAYVAWCKAKHDADQRAYREEREAPRTQHADEVDLFLADVWNRWGRRGRSHW